MSTQQKVAVQPGWTREVGQDGKARPTSVEGVQLQRARIKELLEASPNASDRGIARQISCSPSTVASVRRSLSNLKKGEAGYRLTSEIHCPMPPAAESAISFHNRSRSWIKDSEWYDTVLRDVRQLCSDVPMHFRESLVEQALAELQNEECSRWNANGEITPRPIDQDICIGLFVEDLIVEPTRWCGHGIDQNVVNQYAAILSDRDEDSSFDEPCLVWEKKNQLTLIDGFHRVAAMKQCGRQIINSRILCTDGDFAFMESRRTPLDHPLER